MLVFKKIMFYFKDAVAAGSFHDMDHDYEFGSVSEGFAESSHILEGELCVGGQEHIYMETMGAIAVPKESQEMDLIVTSQCTNMVEVTVLSCCPPKLLIV